MARSHRNRQPLVILIGTAIILTQETRCIIPNHPICHVQLVKTAIWPRYFSVNALRGGGLPSDDPSKKEGLSDAQKRIIDIETEMARTQKNKATMGHLCALKARLAALKRLVTEQSTSKSGGPGDGFEVRATGDARVGFIGFPSVGKSTLLTKLTGYSSPAKRMLTQNSAPAHVHPRWSIAGCFQRRRTTSSQPSRAYLGLCTTPAQRSR